MDLLDIAIVKQLAGGGGGSGTDNYNDLSNLPKINDTTLSGNKTAASLGLQNEINSDNKLSSDLIDDTGATNLFVTEEEKLEWSGKQDEITNANKLDADLVDDEESTNKFVTAQDKETWNAKQNAIDSTHKLSSDLVDDTNHTNKFVTSQEKETWSGKQDALTFDNSPTNESNNPVKSGGIYTALGNKFDTSNIIQSSSGIPASPTDSTVMSAKNVAENYTPNSSLVDTIDNGAKNLINCYDLDAIKAINTDGTWSGNTYTTGNTIFTIYSNGTIGAKTNGQTTQTALKLPVPTLEVGSYILSGCPEGGTESQTNGYLLDYQFVRNGNTVYIIDTGDGREFTYQSTDSNQQLIVMVRNQTTLSTEILYKPMICTKSQFGISPAYEPYALGNQILTPELIELCDSGAKNKLKISGTSATVGEAVFTVNSDGTISVYTTAATTTQRSLTITVSTDGVTLNANDIVSGVPSSDNKVSLEWGMGASGNTKSLWGNNTEGYTTVGYTGSVRYFSVVISSGKSISSSSPLVFKPMVCTQAAWNVSKKYVPHRPNWDLVGSAANIVEYSLKPWANLKSGDNLDNVISMMVTKGVWSMFAAGTNDVLNKPASGIFFVRTLITDSNTGIQIVTMLTGSDRGRSYSRTYAGGWDSWKETTNV